MKPNDIIHIVNLTKYNNYTIYKGSVIFTNYKDNPNDYWFRVEFIANTLQYGAISEQLQCFKLTNNNMNGNYHYFNSDYNLTAFISLDELYQYLQSQKDNTYNINDAIISYKKRLS